MHDSVLKWGEQILTRELCEDKLILEVGSYNVNGSLREYATRHRLRGYIGIDLTYGPGVDLVCPIQDYDRDFGARPDLIICTEMLEHSESWIHDLAAITNLLNTGSSLILTTRSVGFPYHAYPDDHWRFSVGGLTEALRAFGYVSADPMMHPMVIPDHPDSPGVLAYVTREHWTFPLRGTLEAIDGITPMRP